MGTLKVLFSFFLKNCVSQNKKILVFVSSFISPLSFFLFDPSIAFTPSVLSLSYPNLSVIPCFFFLHFQSLLLSLSLSKLFFFTCLHCCFSSLRWKLPADPNEESGFVNAALSSLPPLPPPPEVPSVSSAVFWVEFLGAFPRRTPGVPAVMVTLRWFLGAVWKWRGACEFQLSFKTEILLFVIWKEVANTFLSRLQSVEPSL